MWFSWFWSLMKMSKNVFWVVARLPQRLKSTLFEIFFSLCSVRKNFNQLPLRQTVHCSPEWWKSHIVHWATCPLAWGPPLLISECDNLSLRHLTTTITTYIRGFKNSIIMTGFLKSLISHYYCLRGNLRMRQIGHHDLFSGGWQTVESWSSNDTQYL